MAEDQYSIFLVVAIAFLTCVTLNRGIYLYHKDQYLEVDASKKVDDYYRDYNRELRLKTQKQEKELRIQHFRISLAVSIFIMIMGHLSNHPIVSPGVMLGGLFNVVYSSVASWYYLEEAEKFTVSALGLFVMITYVVYRYKS